MAKKGPVDGGPGPPGKATETLLKQGLRPGLAEAEDRPGCGVPVHSSLSLIPSQDPLIGAQLTP